MADMVNLISGATPEELRALSEGKIEKLEDLWNHVGEDFDEGIKRVSAEVGIATDRLIDVLIDSGDFEEFGEVERAEAQALFKKKIRTLGELRTRIGENPNESVNQLAKCIGTTAENLIALATGLRGITAQDAKTLFRKGIKNVDDLRESIHREFQPGNLIFPSIPASKRLITWVTWKRLISRLKKNERPSYLHREEVLELQRRRINVADDLWSAVGENPDGGIEVLANKTNIESKRLTTLLIQQGKADLESEKGSWFKQHWPDVTVVIAAATIALLALRATGVASLPRAFKMNEKYVFVSQDMKKDQPLQAADLYKALLPSGDNYFQSKEEVVGLILARPVARDKPVQFEDVLRFQVVAVRDVAPAKELTVDDIALVWTPYQKEALTQSDLLQGRKTCARRAIRKDDVILSGFVGECRAPSK